MFDCVITIHGDGKGRNGRYKEDKTDSVSRFMVDNIYLYPHVKKHIIKCDKCDPTEALKFYLSRRLTLSKFKSKPGQVWPIDGLLTSTLARLALSYERMCKKDRPIPKELVNEFIWRSASYDMIDRNWERLTIEELVSGVSLYMKTTQQIYSTSSTRFTIMYKLIADNSIPETLEEFENIVKVASVMFS